MQRVDFELQESLVSEAVDHLLQGLDLVVGALEWAGRETAPQTRHSTREISGSIHTLRCSMDRVLNHLSTLPCLIILRDP